MSARVIMICHDVPDIMPYCMQNQAQSVCIIYSFIIYTSTLVIALKLEI